METQAFAQGEGPAEAVLIRGPALGHGGPGDEVGIDGDDLVIHQIGVVPRDDRGGPDRVEAGEVGLRDDPQNLRR
jgi:hypothetical protein